MDTRDITLLAVALGIVAAMAWGLFALRRRAARFRPDGAVADAALDADGRFALELPAGGAVDLYLRYGLDAVRLSGGGVTWSLIVLVETSRDPSGSGHPFESRYEYLIGDARRGFGEAPIADPFDYGPLLRSGMQVSRGLLLARIPAGGHMVVRGRAEARGGTTCQSFLLFARTPTA